jgi:hypothetical protein
VVVVASVVVVEVVGIEVGVVAGVDEEHPTTTNDATKKPTQRMPPPYGTRTTLPMAISDKVFPTSTPSVPSYVSTYSLRVTPSTYD